MIASNYVQESNLTARQPRSTPQHVIPLI